MTSRRRLKKEIEYVVSDLILDCFTYTSLYRKPNDAETQEIVQGALVLRNELRDLASHPLINIVSRNIDVSGQIDGWNFRNFIFFTLSFGYFGCRVYQFNRVAFHNHLIERIQNLVFELELERIALAYDRVG